MVMLDTQNSNEQKLLGSASVDVEHPKVEHDALIEEHERTTKAKRLCTRTDPNVNGIQDLTKPIRYVRGTNVPEHWITAWAALEVTWKQQTKVPFPHLNRGPEVWKKAADKESILLLELLQTFDGAPYILDSMTTETMIAVTRIWREQCWCAMVEQGKKTVLMGCKLHGFENGNRDM